MVRPKLTIDRPTVYALAHTIIPLPTVYTFSRHVINEYLNSKKPSASFLVASSRLPTIPDFKGNGVAVSYPSLTASSAT